MSLLRRVSSLRYVSYLSVVGTIYVIIVLAFELPFYLSYHQTTEFAHSHRVSDVEMVKPGLGMMGGASYALSSFATHIAIPVAVAELYNPSSRRLKKVNITVTSMQIFILVVLALLGYYTVQGEASPVVVTRPALPGHSNFFMLVACVLFTASQLIAFPLVLMPCRDSLRDLLSISDTPTFHVIATAALILVPTIVAIMDFGLDLILKVLATQVVWICYFAPGVLRVKLSKRPWTAGINLWRIGLATAVTALILLNLAVTLHKEFTE
jgi:amino acid permease